MSERAHPLKTRKYVIVLAVIVAVLLIVAIIFAAVQKPSSDSSQTGSSAVEAQEDTMDVSPDASENLPDQTASHQRETVPGELLVTADDKAILADLVPGGSFDGVAIKTVDVISEGGDGSPTVVKIVVEDESQTDKLREALEAHEGVSAQPNFIYHLM